MATIRKRQGKKGVSWQIDYFDPTGKRIRQSFKKKKDAEAELGKRVSLKAENRYLDVKKEYKNTFSELCEKYKDNFENQASYQTSKQFFIEAFKTYFGKDTLLANIPYVELETYRNHLRKSQSKHGRMLTDATVNRKMSCLRHMFKKAVEWDMMGKNPFDKGSSLLLKENNQRTRYLEEYEIDALLDACSIKIIKFPESKKHTKQITRKDIHYLRDIVECALNTGMRRGEVLSLKWEQIRGNFIYLRKTKTLNPRQIPINDDLAALFKRMRKRLGLKSQYVFIYQGQRIKDLKNGFNAALRRAGIEDFKFHDLRHTFASHFVMRGGGLKALQEILGHKSLTMTMRYAHLAQDHKKEAINLLNGLTAKDTCHKTVTNSLSANPATL
jgi:integrase